MRTSTRRTRTRSRGRPSRRRGERRRIADPIEGDVRLARTNRGLLVQAGFNAGLDAQCSRCLRDIEVPVQVTIDTEALPSLDIDTGLPVDQTVEPDVLRLTDHH